MVYLVHPAASKLRNDNPSPGAAVNGWQTDASELNTTLARVIPPDQSCQSQTLFSLYMFQTGQARTRERPRSINRLR